MRIYKVEIVQQPWTERYFGPPPSWIAPGKSMVILRRAMILLITEEDGRQWYMEIPVGYISDRASVPRITSPLISSAGDLELASYPHDWVYSHGGRLYGVTKSYGDDLFRATLFATPTDIPMWKIKVAHLTVSVFGEGGWKDGWATWPGVGDQK